MSQSYDEEAKVWSETHPKCRKVRECQACDEKIRVGDVYSRTAVLFDGKWETFVRCLRCNVMYHFLNKKICAHGDWDEACAPLLDCGHEYVENWGEEPPPEIVELAFLTPDEAQKRFSEAAK